MPGLAKRLDRVPVASTVAMTVRARALRAAGHSVIMMTIGEPDFKSPPHAIEAAYAAALRGETKYSPQDGLPAMKLAVQRKFRRENKLDVALDEITVSNGGKQSIFNALMATLDAGDEVVIPSPYWGAYPLMTKLAGGEPIFVACPQNNGFKPRPGDIEAAITPRTKWLLLNFPNNPTGAALDATELAAIAEVMRRHPQVWILSDDLYEHLIYSEAGHATLAAVAPDLRDRILTICGVSKTYAMTGWRIGFAAGPRGLIKAMTNVQGHATSGASAVGQAAAIAALEGDQSQVAKQRAIYQQRRDLMVDALNRCDGIVCHRPEGAFYVFPGVAGCLGRVSKGGRRIESDADMAMALLEEAHVATVAGAAFGMSPFLRMSYATDTESLAEGCRRIEAFCAGLSAV
jgi:aspartate aminotransferase